MKFIKKKLSINIEYAAWGLIILGAISGLIIIILFGPYSTNRSLDPDKCSNLGESLGGLVGTLWSLAGLLLFFVALREQQKDVKNNKEVKEYNEVSQRLQRFENTFFQLLGNLHNLINSIELNGKIGKEVFEDLWADFERRSFLSESKNIEELLIHYQNAETTLDEQIGHYFRNLYHLLQYVERQPEQVVSSEDRSFYVTIVGLQLSLSEIRLVAFRTLSLRSKSLGDLLKRYPDFFSDLTIPSNKTIEREVHAKLKIYGN